VDGMRIASGSTDMTIHVEADTHQTVQLEDG
jgi:hypothetical protein